jgi:signal transduction histidine kinase
MSRQAKRHEQSVTRQRRPEPILLGDPGSAEHLAEVSGLIQLAVATAGILGLVTTAIVMLAPSPSRPAGYHSLAVAVVSAVVVALAGLVRRRRKLFSPRVLTRALPVTVVAVALGALLVGPSFAPLVTMFFIWYGLSVTFLSRRAAVALMGWVSVVYGALLALQRGNNVPLFRWEALLGIMVFTAMATNRLVERAWTLARGERAARTEAERARSELETVSADKSRFLARMSHELRTPLNAIIGFSEVLARRSFGPLEPKQAEYVDDVVDSGRHLLALVDDLLDLAKVETGTVELELGQVELAGLLSGSLTLFQEQAGRAQVALHLDAPADLGNIHADARKVKQVVFNLLANALRFTPAGGRVVLGARRSADTVRIWVSDTGSGIAAEEQEAIFEEFHQGSPGREGQGGTGLGLPMARRLVELHGGRLGVESVLGAGSTFATELPVRARPAAEITPAPSGEQPVRLFLGEPDSPERRMENARLLVILGRVGLSIIALSVPIFRFHPPPPQVGFQEWIVLSMFAVAAGIVATVVLWPRWVGAPAVLPYVCAFGTVVISLGMYGFGPGLGDMGWGYVIAVAGVFVLFTARQLAAELVLIGVCYGLVVAHGYTLPLARWVVAMGFVTVTALMVRRFVARIEGLALAERTARGEAERASTELEVASRHKTEFLANMSHELRTPLNVIIGFSEVLESQAFGPLNEKQAEYVGDVLASGRHLLGLINDILDLAKADAGHMELQTAEIDLDATLASVMAGFGQGAAHRNVELRLETPEVGLIEADEAKLSQALGRLITNALKFTPDGGRVTLRATHDTDSVEISVTDTGPGIDPADHRRIFDAFTHGAGTPGADQGSGLGLALARRYAELHSGSLSVRSDLGVGSTFILRVPMRRVGARATVEVA